MTDGGNFTHKDGVSLEKYLRDYVDLQLKALDKANALAGDVIRAELKSICDQLERQELEIRDLRESRAELSGKASQTSVMIAYAISLLGLIVGIVLHFL